MTESMIDRVAQALWLKARERGSERELEFFKEDARDAIKAMREPTARMLEAGNRHMDDFGTYDRREELQRAFPAMIEVALSRTDTSMTLAEAVAALSAPAFAEIARILPHSVEKLPFKDGFYEGRLKQKDPLVASEHPLIEALVELPATAYHEIGGGIGLLPITLGLMGYRAVNIDETPSRVAHGQAILDTLTAEYPRLKANVQMLHGRAPAVFANLATDGACAFSTNIGSKIGWEATVPLLSAIQQRYAFYVFDVCLLLGVFRTPEEWGAQLERVTSLWKREPELLFASGDYQRCYVVKF